MVDTKNQSDNYVGVEVLVDKTSTGRYIDWGGHKVRNELMALAYDDVDPAKAYRMRNCATFLGYRMDGGKKRLAVANFCRVRLCPMCQWRRSLKLYAQMHDILQEMQSVKKYQYIFVTLTVKNVCLRELAGALDRLSQSWTRLIKCKDMRVVAGWERGIEITHDVDMYVTTERYRRGKAYYQRLGLEVGADNPGYDSYHPHIHALLAVAPGYFAHGGYISQERLASLWQRSAKLDYTPVVHLRRVRAKAGGSGSGDDVTSLLDAVAEVAKYSIKDSDIVVVDDWDMTVDTLRALDKILAGRRFVSMGGVIGATHKRLHLDDAEDGDLIHLASDDDAVSPVAPLITYVWQTGYNQYMRSPEG